MSTTYSMPLIQLSKIPEPAPAHSALGAQVKRATVKRLDRQGLVFVIDDHDIPGRSKAQDELNRLAGEIHDGVAQYFSAVCMQLEIAKDILSPTNGDCRSKLDGAIEIAKRGLVEARRCAHSLRTSVVEESGLIVELHRLAERWHVDGKWRCEFKCDRIPENKVSGRAKHELLRIAEEAMHNAVRHANPTLIVLTLRWRPPNVVLQIIDHGNGISADRLQRCESFGLRNMRARAKRIGARFELRTVPNRGTSITVTVPIYRCYTTN